MPNTVGHTSKSKMLRIEMNSGSDSDDNEHELSYYMKDKVKLMKEVLKLIKPKKIKSMAPDCIKHLDIVEINSMLLEELLGISNKRLQYIFNGENVDRETSSSDSDEEKKPIDVISLDDISDNDIEVTINPDGKGHHKRRKQHKSHKIKNESTNPEKKQKLKVEDNSQVDLGESEREKLMSVLELLELQARARAIKSQIALEASKKKVVEEVVLKHEDDSDPEAVIIESPKHKEIVLTSSDSEDFCIVEDNHNLETETTAGNKQDKSNVNDEDNSNVPDKNVIVLDGDNEHTIDNKTLNMKKQKLLSKIKKIKLIRHKGLTETNVQEKTDENKTDIRQTVSEIGPEEKGKETDSLARENKVTTINPDVTEKSTAAEVELCPMPEPEKLQDKNEVENNSSDIKKNSVHSEIDNDEIVVINLDEDEMKGIENG